VIPLVELKLISQLDKRRKVYLIYDVLYTGLLLGRCFSGMKPLPFLQQLLFALFVSGIRITGVYGTYFGTF
jgi:hypothetical protein